MTGFIGLIFITLDFIYSGVDLSNVEANGERYRKVALYDAA